MSYRVKTVAELTGIPRNTLVAWERRYHLLDVTRTEGGYRLYSDDDVAYLQQLRALVDAGLSISEAIANSAPQTAAKPAPQSLWREALRHLLRYDRVGAAPVLRRAEQLSFDDAVSTFWNPLLVEVGALWEASEITVAQEHYVSAITREHLLAMFRSLDGGRGRSVICACVPDEQHDLPLLGLAVRLALRGWKVTWLGADVPVEDLAACCAQQRPELLCLSTIVPPSPATVLNVARRLRAAAPPETRILVGGAGAEGLGAHSVEGLTFDAGLEAAG